MRQTDELRGIFERLHAVVAVGIEAGRKLATVDVGIWSCGRCACQPPIPVAWWRVKGNIVRMATGFVSCRVTVLSAVAVVFAQGALAIATALHAYGTLISYPETRGSTRGTVGDRLLSRARYCTQTRAAGFPNSGDQCLTFANTRESGRRAIGIGSVSLLGSSSPTAKYSDHCKHGGRPSRHNKVR